MRHGFIRVAAATPQIVVADCETNLTAILTCAQEAEARGAQLLVLPELCITGYTCGDLFLQETLLCAAKEGLRRLAAWTRGKDLLLVVGLPFVKRGKLYNVAAVLQNGRVLGLVPKRNIPNYSEYYEARHFTPGDETVEELTLFGEQTPFGGGLLFACRQMEEFVVGIEICEDLWVAQPPSGALARAGATVILNLSASDETVGKEAYRRELVKGQSARLICGYVYADAGEGESTTDLVFAAHNLIAENGRLLAEASRFQNELVVSELDLQCICAERRRLNTYLCQTDTQCRTVEFAFPSLSKQDRLPELPLSRSFARTPFVPADTTDREKRCAEILRIQAMGLKQRLIHAHAKTAVIGISGGLDSTLALLVTREAFALLEKSPEELIAVTMPCFGTTDRTYRNAVAMAKEIGATLREVPIGAAVRQHFSDIGHDEALLDVTYENAQARERTQVLMDIANQTGGLVVGTGDMSELALGWATYNGDHMSMYGVNASVPKTLVRYLVGYYADVVGSADGRQPTRAFLPSEALAAILRDVLATPVSPELLPPKDGEITQKTEALVGDYELHDFFLYYFIRFGFSPDKIYRLAVLAFHGTYAPETIEKWLRVFYQRFFAQQFKRSCLPDGPKVGSVALSPRGDWRMPSDASSAQWLRELL